MIYYLTKFAPGENRAGHPDFSFDLTEIEFKEMVQMLGASNISDDWKGKPGYYLVKLNDNFFVDQREEKVEPTSGDVVIYGDRKFGIVKVLEKKSVGKKQELKCLIYQLPEISFGQPRSFGRGN